MRKKELLAGVYNVYSVYDKVSKHHRGIFIASNDEDFVRLHLPQIILSVALRDLQIFKVGIFNDVTGEIKPTIKKRVSTDCYKFPHSRLSPEGENLSLDELENSINETKNKIIALKGENDESEAVNE